MGLYFSLPMSVKDLFCVAAVCLCVRGVKITGETDRIVYSILRSWHFVSMVRSQSEGFYTGKGNNSEVTLVANERWAGRSWNREAGERTVSKGIKTSPEPGERRGRNTALELRDTRLVRS